MIVLGRGGSGRSQNRERETFAERKLWRPSARLDAVDPMFHVNPGTAGNLSRWVGALAGSGRPDRSPESSAPGR
ncbi:hypothetical protein BTZ20_0008 [Rhodococcus sp. MTM3W5.2]|nr:hypothetical protein BTZ20_0008 [Rhodococcus sp. MTM3W5.2]